MLEGVRPWALVLALVLGWSAFCPDRGQAAQLPASNLAFRLVFPGAGGSTHYLQVASTRAAGSSNLALTHGTNQSAAALWYAETSSACPTNYPTTLRLAQSTLHLFLGDEGLSVAEYDEAGDVGNPLFAMSLVSGPSGAAQSYVLSAPRNLDCSGGPAYMSLGSVEGATLWHNVSTLGAALEVTLVEVPITRTSPATGTYRLRGVDRFFLASNSTNSRLVQSSYLFTLFTLSAGTDPGTYLLQEAAAPSRYLRYLADDGILRLEDAGEVPTTPPYEWTWSYLDGGLLLGPTAVPGQYVVSMDGENLTLARPQARIMPLVLQPVNLTADVVSPTTHFFLGTGQGTFLARVNITTTPGSTRTFLTTTKSLEEAILFQTFPMLRSTYPGYLFLSDSADGRIVDACDTTLGALHLSSSAYADYCQAFALVASVSFSSSSPGSVYTLHNGWADEGVALSGMLGATTHPALALVPQADPRITPWIAQGAVSLELRLGTSTWTGVVLFSGELGANHTLQLEYRLVKAATGYIASVNASLGSQVLNRSLPFTGAVGTLNLSLGLPSVGTAYSYAITYNLTTLSAAGGAAATGDVVALPRSDFARFRAIRILPHDGWTGVSKPERSVGQPITYSISQKAAMYTGLFDLYMGAAGGNILNFSYVLDADVEEGDGDGGPLRKRAATAVLAPRFNLAIGLVGMPQVAGQTRYNLSTSTMSNSNASNAESVVSMTYDAGTTGQSDAVTSKITYDAGSLTQALAPGSMEVGVGGQGSVDSISSSTGTAGSTIQIVDMVGVHVSYNVSTAILFQSGTISLKELIRTCNFSYALSGNVGALNLLYRVDAGNVTQSRVLAPVTESRGSVSFSYSIRSKSGGTTRSSARIAYDAAALQGDGSVPAPLGGVGVTFDPESGVVSRVDKGSSPLITLGPQSYTAGESPYAPPSQASMERMTMIYTVLGAMVGGLGMVAGAVALYLRAQRRAVTGKQSGSQKDSPSSGKEGGSGAQAEGEMEDEYGPSPKAAASALA